MKPILLLLALGLPLFGATTLSPETPALIPKAVDSPVGKALELFQDGRYHTAVETARPLADAGNADALFLLGYASETGQGAEVSRNNALEFYRRAAEGGHREAVFRRALILLNSEDEAERQSGRQVLESAAQGDPATAGRILGEAYLRGLLGEEPDFDKAVEWWTRAADAGETASLVLLARLYAGEFGFPDQADPGKAVGFLRKAAEQGDPSALIPLGARLLNGPEETRNETEGQKWLSQAADQGQALAYLTLGDHEEHVLKDPKSAVATYRRGAEAGQLDCMVRLAGAYAAGNGVDKDEAKGREWLEKAADAGNAVACLQLVGLLAQSEEPDVPTIYRYLLRAAASGNADAQNTLGLLYLSGRLGSPDAPAAAAWFTRAAQAGFPAAQFNLGSLYERGVGVPVNLNNAGDLYSRATKGGNAAAPASLGRLYALGLGTERNPARAWALISLAVERGDPNAKALLDEVAKGLDEAQLDLARKHLIDLHAEEPKARDASPDKP